MNRHGRALDTAAMNEQGLNGLDRLTRTAAVALSRRRFLKKLSLGVAGLGLGLVAAPR